VEATDGKAILTINVIEHELFTDLLQLSGKTAEEPTVTEVKPVDIACGIRQTTQTVVSD
jgi:hypothetical protein